eukprot:SAG31_NODE_1822_length_7193_cov_3.631802_8_plen_177_part_00
MKGLRWRKTVPKAPLEDPLDTKAYGADCAQMGPGWVSVRSVTFSFCGTFLVFMGLIEKYGTNRESVTLQLSPQSVDKDCHNFMKGCPNMTWAATTSEDCLFLNIYAPEDSSEAPGAPTSTCCLRAMVNVLSPSLQGLALLSLSTFPLVPLSGVRATMSRATPSARQMHRAGRTPSL